MSKNYLKFLHNLSFEGRVLMEAAGVGSCFDCFSYVLIEDVKQWTDNGQTAICPNCKIDSVVPGVISSNTLTDMYDKYFTV